MFLVKFTFSLYGHFIFFNFEEVLYLLFQAQQFKGTWYKCYHTHLNGWVVIVIIFFLDIFITTTISLTQILVYKRTFNHSFFL